MSAEETPDRGAEAAFEALEPTAAQLERMRSAVLVAAPVDLPPSLTAEWLELLRARPVANALYVAAAVAALLLGTPLGALGRLLGALG
jgi:hypothetical protein